MSEFMQAVQKHLSESNLKPIFADEVMVARAVKAIPIAKAKVEKEGHVYLIFVDRLSQRPIAKIVLSPSTAKGLTNALGENLRELEIELKDKTLPKSPEVKISQPKENGYIG